jgi:hypothetical protein
LVEASPSTHRGRAKVTSDSMSPRLVLLVWIKPQMWAGPLKSLERSVVVTPKRRVAGGTEVAILGLQL